MDWLTFISNMTGALAWPLVIGAALWYFKRELKTFFNGMKRLKLGPMEAEMFELKTIEVRQLAQAAASIEAPPAANSLQPATDQRTPSEKAKPADGAGPSEKYRAKEDPEDLLTDILSSQLPPRQMILKAWVVLEDALRSFAERSGLKPTHSVVTMLLDLKNNEQISAQQLRVIKDLYALRGALINTTISATEDSALNFIVTVGSILKPIGLSDKPGRSARLREASLAVSLSPE